MEKINLVWLKRDLRLTDHAPLQAALTSGRPTLLLYLFEPMLLGDAHYSERHWRFVCGNHCKPSIVIWRRVKGRC